MPQSMTTAPGFTQSPFTNSAFPMATTKMSAVFTFQKNILIIYQWWIWHNCVPCQKNCMPTKQTVLQELCNIVHALMWNQTHFLLHVLLTSDDVLVCVHKKYQHLCFFFFINVQVICVKHVGTRFINHSMFAYISICTRSQLARKTICSFICSPSLCVI